MACSKIFSDLPELTYKIIQYFRKDISTLYSCILVNRLWCRLTIPLLWEDPFSLPTQNYRCIKTYFCFLNEDDKARFNEYGINDNLFLTNPLFNYPSFIKYLDISKICHSIEYWVDTLVDKSDNRLGHLVYRLLFEVFIENEGNLHSFEVVHPRSYGYNYFNDNIYLILQNPNLIYDIRNLTFHIYNNDLYQNIAFLEFLYSNCKSISSIVIKFPTYRIDINNYSLIENHLSQLIISQNNLKKISFESFVNLYNPLLTLKNSNCSNTLNTIIFYFIDFKNIISILQEVFDQLNVLESIHILYCDSLNSDFVQQIIRVIKPFKLRSLFTKEIILNDHIESLLLLLQKFSDCLENFGFENGDIGVEYNEQKQQLFEFIMKYCKNIRYFYSCLPYYDNNSIYLFIEKNQHNINYLTIEGDFIENHILYAESSTVLRNLGQVLPSRLEYLCLTLSFIASDLEIFLKNSQNTFIKKLLLNNVFLHTSSPRSVDTKVLFFIKKYIMKKERVKYLAILESDSNGGIQPVELFFLKDEVNEYKLHNIIVQKYHDLYIDAHSYINYHLQY
ncbi:unnamed protein product [Rhizophagus irregularis]|nr:unnamed protein product [Rhizophagus irregularis]